MRYEIKRTNGSTEWLVASVSPTGKQSKKAMGENVVDFSFTLPKYIDFKLMDFVLVYGERYQLNVLPSVKKVAKNSFEYNMQLEAVFYDLAKVQLQFLNPQNQLLEPSFTLMGNAGTIVGLIVENANRHSAGWSVGVVDDTGYKNFTFNAENCLQGLNRLAQDFETEFWIDNKTIHLQKREQSSGMSFGYGQGKGLYSILRGNNKNINIVTRLYVRGSAQNLPAGYRNSSGSLLLPGGKTYFEDPAKVALYGLIEASQVFDVKPEREGVVSSIVPGTGNWKFFADNTIDFDLNAVKLDIPSKVRFNTGQLAGYSFEITAYNHQTKQVTIKKNEEEKSIEMPSDLLRPAVGDKYVLVDIAMPESYVSAAENRLNQAALTYYEKNSDPTLNFAYNIDCDPIWFKQLGVKVTLGNTVMITDTDMGINGEIRIAAYKRDLQSAFKYEFEVTDSIGANEIIRQYAQQQRTLQLIESSGLLDINQIRKNIFLNRLSESSGYLLLSGTKVKAGIADYAPEAGHALLADYAQDSDKWDGHQFDDYLNQPVRKTDAVKFISVVADTVNSTLYVSGFTGTGYKINPDGSAEFDSLTVRKELNVNVLNVREITGSGGSIAVTNVAKIKEVFDRGTYWQCTINTDDNTIAVQFRTNDIVRCQVWDGKRLKYYTALVAEVGTGAFNLIKAGKTGAGIPSAGDSVFQFGNTTDTSRQGLIYMTNSDTGAPYLDVLDGISSDSLAGKTKVRLGKLRGINDPDLGQLDGYGIYAERAFIKGKIVVTGGNAETKDGATAKANAAGQSAIQAAANDAAAKINNLQIGVRNYFKKTTTISTTNGAVVVMNHIESPNGFLMTGVANLVSVARCNQVITGIGIWTVSFIAKSNIAFTLRCDLCDVPYTEFSIGTDWLRYSFTVDVTRYTADIYNFLDFDNIPHVYLWVNDLKVEKGGKATDWTAAPEDISSNAQAKADAALSAAQIYADNSAQSKANAAQLNAISQASNDAQVRATAAQNAAGVLAQQLVDGIKVGGRNLIEYSKLGNIEFNDGATSAVTVTDKFVSVTEFTRLSGTGGYQTTHAFHVVAGTEIIISVKSKDMGGAGWSIGFSQGANIYQSLTTNNYDKKESLGDGWFLYSRKSTVDSNNVLGVFGLNTIDGKFRLCQMKMEQGNKVTDWIPAPEDVQYAIDYAKALGDKANTAYSNLTSKLKGMAYRDIDAAAAQGVTIIDNGSIVTFKADVAYLRANVANIEYLNGLEFAFTQGTVDRLKARVINATQIIVDGGGATVGQAQGFANSAQTAAANDATSKVNALQIGGRNYFKRSSVIEPYLGAIVTKPHPEAPNGFLITGVQNKTVIVRVPYLITGNGYWTVSFWAKSNGSINLQTDLCDNPSRTFAVGSEWVKCTLTVNVANYTASIYNFLDFDNIPWVYVWIKDLKVEQGDKATDWTPAPEDILAVTDNFTVINGGVISTNTIKVGTLTQANAGITGVTDQGADSVRIWAGGTYENRYTANYQVRDNGRVIAKNAEISGKIVAAEGNIGSLRINQSGLAAGSENTWTANSESVVFNPSYLLMRKCGSRAGSSFAMSQTREMSFGLGYYPGSAGSSDNHTVVIKNNIRNTYGSAPPDPSFRRRNIAMRLEARDSDENIALEIGNGRVYLNDVWDVNESTGPLKGYVKAYYNSAWNKYVLVLDDTRPHLEAVTDNNGLYGNDVQSGTYQKHCGSWEDVGSYETYTVPANTYFAATKAAANTLAMNDVNNNGQTQADLNGYCQYNPR